MTSTFRMSEQAISKQEDYDNSLHPYNSRKIDTITDDRRLQIYENQQTWEKNSGGIYQNI